MPATTATIRRATQADVLPLAAMGREFILASGFCKTLGASPKCDLAGVLAVLVENPAACVFVADDDGRVVGGIVAMEAPLWFDQDTIVASELAWWVDPQHRKCGLRLLDAFEAWAADRGLATTVSDIVASADASKVYERRGYSCVERSFARGVN